MCGIAGYWKNTDLSSENKSILLSRMQNRGPDNQNFWEKSTNDKYLAFFHSRLSILDISVRSNQPMRFGNYIIIFNGEIYNYIELRKKLVSKGIIFKTESDTEVILHYFSVYGSRCVDFFEGMWSFAIYDETLNRVFLSRDRFGEKPLYYYENRNGFYFGSEIKFIQSMIEQKLQINKEMINKFLFYGYKIINKENDTFFKNLSKLPSGHSMILENGKIKKIYRYWNSQICNEKKINQNELIELARKKLINSLKLRMRSDVPVAFCLSGGIDSASLVSIASKVLSKKIKTYSIISKDKRYNEKENIQLTIEDTESDYSYIFLDKKDFLVKLRKLIIYHDSPISTISYYIHSLISEEASRDGFKVIISGTGADEIFTGYYHHFLLQLLEIKESEDFSIKFEEWKSKVQPFIRNPLLNNLSIFEENISDMEYIYDPVINVKKLIKKKSTKKFTEKKKYKNLLKNRMFNELFHEIVPTILHEDDLNSMMNSIENRSPFLDTELFNLGFAIPTNSYIKNGHSKFILRESMKGILNDKVRLDFQKKGFNANIQDLVNLEDASFKNFLLDKKSPISEYVNLELFENIISHKFIDNSLNKFIFSFINCKIFLDEFI